MMYWLFADEHVRALQRQSRKVSKAYALGPVHGWGIPPPIRTANLSSFDQDYFATHNGP
jgi:hypothetical protein